jgi:hypothetical protein
MRRPALAILTAGLLAGLAVPSAAAAPAAAKAPASVQWAATPPPGSPGPPPANGTNLPPSPGSTVVPTPSGGAVTIGPPTGPGLLRDASNTIVNTRSHTFALPIACQARGTVRVKAHGIRGVVGTGRYRCRSHLATVKVTVRRAVAPRLVRLKKVNATATVTQQGRRFPLSLTLVAGGARTAQGRFWTDGHLLCRPDGITPLATVVAPDFTYRDVIPVSIRTWLATYTARNGWQWQGVGGPNRGHWDTWTSSPGGIVEWHPLGQVQPSAWTWGPVSFATGAPTWAIGVYEIVYWSGGGPKWQWGYINSGSTGAVAAGGPSAYCSYG